MIYDSIIENIDKYSLFNLNQDLRNELTFISIVKSDIEWSELSSEEKHEKRKIVLSVIKKVGNAEEFELELLLIELYELIVPILNFFNSKEFKTELETRLNVLFYVFLFHLDEYRDARKMSTGTFKYIINVLSKLADSENSVDYDKLYKLYVKLSKILTPTDV